jgi:hypothetical protein
VDQVLCPTARDGVMCGTLYPTIGYIDTCDTARITGFVVQPNTAILDPLEQSLTGANAYTFFVGQSVTITVDRNQPRVLADELMRIIVTNPNAPALTAQISSVRAGFNITGVGAAQSITANSCFGLGGPGCATGTTVFQNASFTVSPSNVNWGTGSGISFSIAVGLPGQCVTPCSCGGGACSASYGTSKSGQIPATVASETIRVLPTTLTNVNVFDPVLNKAVDVNATEPGSTPGRGGVVIANQSLSVTYTTYGGTARQARSASLFFSWDRISNCATGGGTQSLLISVPGSSLQFVRLITWTYPGLSLLGDNTAANGGAMNFSVNSNCPVHHRNPVHKCRHERHVGRRRHSGGLHKLQQPLLDLRPTCIAITVAVFRRAANAHAHTVADPLLVPGRLGLNNRDGLAF